MGTPCYMLIYNYLRLSETLPHEFFTYYLTPNWDFIHDLLYFGDAVEVLEPESLRARLKEESNNTTNNYNHENNNN